jgi:AcrR family transcriptional regulator
MARWEPGAAERLQRAALELFATRGFDQTTAADIAQSVGLTERTFFRYFRDKRDVVFHGQDRFGQLIIDAMAAAPPDAPPMGVVVAGLAGIAPFFADDRRPWSRMRQKVINENPSLRERERHKLADMGSAVADELRARGVGEPAATLAGESAATVFGVSFMQWISEDEERSFPDIVSSMLSELSAVTAGDR